MQALDQRVRISLYKVDNLDGEAGKNRQLEVNTLFEAEDDCCKMLGCIRFVVRWKC